MIIKNIVIALAIGLAMTVSVSAQSQPFSKQLTLQGVTFNINSPNAGAANTVTITTKGLARNPVMKREIEGLVTGAEVADLNNDRSPEIYIFSAADGGNGKFFGLSANNKKSMTDIYLPEIDPDAKEAKGYKGRDEFAVVEGTFVRRFPIYKPGDADGKPTGGTRQIQYKLKPGEAGWVLEVNKVIEY